MLTSLPIPGFLLHTTLYGKPHIGEVTQNQFTLSRQYIDAFPYQNRSPSEKPSASQPSLIPRVTRPQIRYTRHEIPYPHREGRRRPWPRKS
jgi:hypothetical protein